MILEERARINIDDLLEQAGWAAQDAGAVNLYASNGLAVREFRLKPGHGTADCLLYVNHNAAGVLEARPEGSAAWRVATLPSSAIPGPQPLCAAKLQPNTSVETESTASGDARNRTQIRIPPP